MGLPGRKQGRVLGTQPGQHVRPELSCRFKQIIGVLLLDHARLVVQARVPQMGALREKNQRLFLFFAYRKLQ